MDDEVNIEKEIDHRIQLIGVPLGEEPPGMRERIRRDVERHSKRQRNTIDTKPLNSVFATKGNVS